MRRRRDSLVVLLLAVGLAGRLTLALALPNDEPDDGRMYALMAHNILAHGIYSNDDTPPYAPTYVRVPGYPLFLALIYRLFGDGNNTAVRLVQACVDTATCGAIGLLACAWSPAAWDDLRRRRAGLWGLALAVACPFQAVYVTTILTESLATFLGSVALVAATSGLRDVRRDRNESAAWFPRLHRPWVVAGVAIGLMTLVRPESGLYGAAIGLTLLGAGIAPWRLDGFRAAMRAVLRPALVLALTFTATLAPWMLRNALVFGVFEPLNPRSLSMPGEFVANGYAAWLRSWIDHPRYVGPLLFNLDRLPIAIDQVPARAFDSADERAQVAELFREYSTPAPDAEPDDTGQVPPGGMTPDIDARFGAIAAARARRAPLRQFVVLPLKRAVTLWFDPHADYYPFAGFLFPLSDLDPDRQQAFWLPLFLGLTLAWSALAAAGALRLVREPGSRVWVVLAGLLIVPRLVLLASMENPEPRYTMEFFPLLTIFAACALARRQSAVEPPARPDV
jgi:hypothetical protein